MKSNFEAFQEFFEALEQVGIQIGVPLQRAQLIGRKRDLISLAKTYNPQLAELSEASFEEYLRKLGCKFLSPQRSKTDDRFKTFFAARLRSKHKLSD